MSLVSLLGVNVLNNPAHFTDKYEFEITFECLESLDKDLEWKLTYVGSATSDQYDQELDSLLVGPIPVGVNKFVFEADAPDTKRIPDAELIGVTVILLTCAYDGREFVRVGYYVNNEYDNEEMQNDPPPRPVIEKIRRNVLAEKPRVTRFAIKWDSELSAPAEFPPEQPEADLQADDDEYGAEELQEEAEALEVEAGPSGVDDKVADKDAEMEGVLSAEVEMGADEEEMSDDGSVDLEGETEDEIDDEEVEGEVEAADGNEMEIDSEKQPVADAKQEIMAH